MGHNPKVHSELHLLNLSEGGLDLNQMRLYAQYLEQSCKALNKMQTPEMNSDHRAQPKGPQ